MKYKNEEFLLKVIRYTPILFVLLLFTVTVIFLYVENKSNFNKEKELIETNFIKKNKQDIKLEIDRIFKLIDHKSKNIIIDLRLNIKEKVYEAHTIAHNIYEKNKNSKTKDEITKLISDTLSPIRFNNGRGYYFINDINGEKLLEPVNTSLQGKNLINYRDSKGYELVKTIIKTIKNKSERYDSYFWANPRNNNTIEEKLSFYKTFEPLNIAIGTGEFISDYQKKIQNELIDYINSIRYGTSGYIYILDYDLVYISHIDKSLVGKSLKNAKNVKEVSRIYEFAENLKKKGSGFTHYTQSIKPINKKINNARKISYSRVLNDWKWIIGTGFYEDDVKKEILNREKYLNEKLRTHIFNFFIIAIIFTIILAIIFKYISNIIESKFKQYKEDIKEQEIIMSSQAKMAAMGEMIGNIAHQWRQPLSTISTIATGIRIQKEFDQLDEKEFYASLTKINDTTQYLSKTIDDFRNYFKNDKEKSEFYIDTLLDNTLQLIHTKCIDKNIVLVKDNDSVKVFNYQNELVQVLLNILNNATYILEKKSGKKFIFIKSKKVNNNLVLKIKDSGGGIDETIINRIFEPYFTTKHKSQGTGIGLYMSEEIISKHMKGSLKAENKTFIYEEEEYKGAELTITIPL